NLIQVYLPALRERREDIPLLASFFADQQSTQNGLPGISFSSDALELLEKLPFPGNIRELKNLIDRTILISGKTWIDAEDIRAQITVPEGNKAPKEIAVEMKLDELETQTIRKAIEQHGGNLSKVARTLGISRAALYRRMEKYGI
ncbi:MAG: helix-turn-helix domain-containing protein, partial [Petrimonas sp.]|nr:helix-turn-helix domain-containing protein [Petrimonas sp.]